MYQALYRKWRPRTFDDVVGQDHITATLRRQVETGRLSHAYLFVGTRGTGKTTCAKILARAVNCEHPVNGCPCNCCAACRGIEDGSILDVVEMDAASNNRVDDVRALQDEAIYTPGDVKKRVYIIDEVHMLSPAAFNALLKILEEPPEHLMFILCTTELHKVLPTIVSRCQRHSFKRIDTATIAARLSYVAKAEGMNLTPDAADLLAGLADGGMRDALSLLDQCSADVNIDADAVHAALGLAGALQIENLLDAVIRHDTDATLSAFTDLWTGGKDPAGILDELCGLLRDILLVHTAGRSASRLVSGVHRADTLNRYAQTLGPDELLDALATLTAADLSGTNPRRAAEIALIRLCLPQTGDSPSALRHRIAQLENKVALLASGTALPADTAATARIPTDESKSDSQYIPAPVREPVPAPVQKSAPEPVRTDLPEPEPMPAYDEQMPPPPGDDDLPWYTDDDVPPAPTDYQPTQPPHPAEKPTCDPESAQKPKPAAVPNSAPAKEKPKTAAAVSLPVSDDFWPQLIDAVRLDLDIISAAYICSSDTVGRLVGDTLTIYTETPFLPYFNDASTLNMLRTHAAILLGHDIQVMATDTTPPPLNEVPVPAAAPFEMPVPAELPAETASEPVPENLPSAQPAPEPIPDRPNPQPEPIAQPVTPAEETSTAPVPDEPASPLDELRRFPNVRFE